MSEYICYCCKREIKKNEISMGMGVPEFGPRYWCYGCKPIPEEENDDGEFGMGGDWWKEPGDDN